MGQFRDKVISLWESAELGTGFHEAFHAAFRLFLTNKEREQLYKEFRNKEGYSETYRGVKKKNSEFTDLEIEESLAEEFRESVINNEIPVTNWNVLKKFWQFIKDMFAHVFYNKTYKDILFEKIQTGYYQNAKVSKNYIGGSAFKLAGKSNDFTEKVLNTIDVSFFNILNKYININNLEIKLFNEEGGLNQDIRNIYEYIYQEYLKLKEDIKNNPNIDSTYIDYITDKINFNDEVIPAHIKRLKELKITADVNNYEKQFENDTDDFIEAMQKSELGDNEDSYETPTELENLSLE